MKRSVLDTRGYRPGVFLFVIMLAVLAVFTWRPADTSAHISISAGNPAQTKDTTQDVSASPIFAEFDAWSRRHLNNDFSDISEHYKLGESLAIERRRLLKELIQVNPQAALKHKIDSTIENRLPADVARHLEKRITAKGDFIVQVFDAIESENSSHASDRTEREVVFDETRYRAFVYGRKASMTTKFDIPLRGIILDDLMAVDENSVQKLERSEYETRNVDAEKLGVDGVAAETGDEIVYFSNQAEFEKYVNELTEWEAKIAPVRFGSNVSGDQLSPWTEGAKTVLIIRVDFPDRQGEPVDSTGLPLTETRAQNVINNSVNPFYVNNSYNKTSLRSPVVTPVVRMPQPQSFYTSFQNIDLLYTDGRNAARSAGFETDNFNLDFIAFSFTQSLGFGGAAKIGAKGVLLNGSFDFKIIAHELGHNYGLLHANVWRTTDGTVIGAGANVEYGDAFDLMGGGSSQITHHSAGYKRRLDWLTEANVQTVTDTGVYRVFAFDVINAPTGVHALKIRKDNLKDYWVEFRQAITSAPNLVNGALLRWDFAQQGFRQTQLLDMTPNTTSLADSPILIGQSFTDNTSGITITVLGKGNTVPESLDIRVELNRSIINGAAFDFDGDNKSDIGVFRPENGAWYLQLSTAGFNATNFGIASDIIVPAKFNGDRTTDIAVYRDGTWFVRDSFGGNGITVQFGAAGDIPLPADYDGDGLGEMAVYRPSNGTWYLWNWAFQRFTAIQFGISTDKPVPADYDGDRKTDIAVYRPSDGTWYLLQSTAGFRAVNFGISTDKPVLGDFDGDGKTDISVYRPENGTWYQQRSREGFTAQQFGVSTDKPVPADYDGDGRTDIAVYRPANGAWYLLQSRSGFSALNFGLSQDKPVSAFP
ncbi:MAG TPA: FG-GAP-like repeat-containing protein [Pyrinomonadaceae bacterium]|nr:FG-GAP-like repeat-containing protein [Pyrinomonadaceae bacterium]